MRELLGEIGFRAAKIGAAIVVGFVVLRLVVGDAPLTPEQALLGFLAGAAVVLLVERSPF